MSRRGEILGEHRAAIRAAAARHGGEAIALVGSVARGEDTESSDVDFIVRFGPGASLLDVAGLAVELKDLLGCDVDVVPADSEIYFRDSMLRDAIDL